MSHPQTNVALAEAFPGFEDEYAGLVSEVQAQVSAGLARAAKFKPRTGAEVKRNFAAEASTRTYEVEGDINEGGEGADEVARHVHMTLAGLPDNEAEALYAIAANYVTRAAQLLEQFGRSVTVVHGRYCVAVAGQLAVDMDPGLLQAMDRALGLLLTSSQQVADAFDEVLLACADDILYVRDVAFRLDRLITELELYARDLPHAIDRAKVHLDYGMLKLGVVAFQEAVVS